MSSASQADRNVKKQYEKPNLKVYGNIEGLTATAGCMFTSMADSGLAVCPNKTS